ncbi:hypothetical protein M5K25_002336 [Dendrobium thyrsiflorum]|uniref:Protein PLASTID TRANSCRIPTIONALLY ACTIVE 7 n=1 Tax=Dendrobium thyrsiflorum TaxID=117978 RepID=A0ABD0VT53_DENTH
MRRTVGWLCSWANGIVVVSLVAHDTASVQRGEQDGWLGLACQGMHGSTALLRANWGKGREFRWFVQVPGPNNPGFPMDIQLSPHVHLSHIPGINIHLLFFKFLHHPSLSTHRFTNSQKEGHNGRRIWRRRKLSKRDVKIEHKMDRVPFLEEQVRKIRETGKIMSLDIERLLLSEENRFAFVNEVAAEATAYVEKNRDEYGGKKAILHVLSNRMNDAGFHRSEAYMETDPFKPGPRYLRIPET